MTTTTTNPGACLVLITDHEHPDYGTVTSRWRQVDALHVEYRDGGIWSRLHVSQYRLVAEDLPLPEPPTDDWQVMGRDYDNLETWE